MEKKLKKPIPGNIAAKARQLLKARTGWAVFTLDEQIDTLADSGKKVYVFRARRPDQINASGVTIWLDEGGEEISVAASARSASKPSAPRLASARVDVASVKARSPRSFASSETEAITLSPSENVLTLQQGDTFPETLIAHIPANFYQLVDVYFLADTTGSMGEQLQIVKDNIASILATLTASGYNFAFGAGNYKDFPSDPYQFQHNISPTSDMAAVVEAVNYWYADGGNDGAEAQFYALDRLANDPGIGWRPGAQRIVVWMGDYPGHDPICNALTGLGYDITEDSVIGSLQANAIKVIAVSVGIYNGLDADPTPLSGDYASACGIGGSAGQATRIADATGGTAMSELYATDLAYAILNLVEPGTGYINYVQLVPTGDTASFVTYLSPDGYGPIDPSGGPFDLPFEVVFTGAVPCSTAPQVFYGTIDLVVDGVTAAQKQVQITVPACSEGGPCAELEAAADAALLQLAGTKYFTVPSEGSSCGDILPPGSVCGEAGLPDLRPCFLLKWGDGPRDQFETEDFEIALLAVCSPYSNVAFGKICLYNIRAVKADGSPVENLPDGTPSVLIVPSREVCMCEVAPCSCSFVELAIKTSSAAEGGYRILFDYCVEEVKLSSVSGAGAFSIELWRS